MNQEAERLLDELDMPGELLPTPAPVLINGLRYSHKAMIDVLIAQPWLRQNDLAAMFKRSPSWISTIMASDAFQAAFAERKDEIIDPSLRLSIEEQTRGLYARSLEILREKLDAPAAVVPDQLAIQTFAQTSRALGYGARVEPTVQVNINNHIEAQADNLVQLLRREKAKVAIEGEVVDGQT